MIYHSPEWEKDENQFLCPHILKQMKINPEYAKDESNTINLIGKNWVFGRLRNRAYRCMMQNIINALACFKASCLIPDITFNKSKIRVVGKIIHILDFSSAKIIQTNNFLP